MIADRTHSATTPDEELMKRVARGDSRAFEAIYDRHHRQAYSLAWRIVGPAGGAEEATQEAFLSAWRSASKFDPERASLTTWLFTLVRHRSIDWLRGTKPQMTHQDLTGAAERVEAPERTEDQVLSIYESDQARRLVDGLPPEQRLVIDLAYFAGYTHMEIAAKVGIPLGTVKGRARLALEKLRAATERESAPLAAA